VTVLLLSIGAFLGAPTRFLADRAISARVGGRFPAGTLCVNVVASLVLGVLLGWRGGADATVVALVGTGFCGALSTYSTFSYETMQLSATRRRLTAITYVATTLTAGIGAAAIGWVFARGVS
jgi:CrcB protein